jgi:hypothetical protein
MTIGNNADLPHEGRDTEKVKLAVEPFQPVLEIFKQLEEEDPKPVF